MYSDRKLLDKLPRRPHEVDDTAAMRAYRFIQGLAVAAVLLVLLAKM